MINDIKPYCPYWFSITRSPFSCCTATEVLIWILCSMWFCLSLEFQNMTALLMPPFSRLPQVGLVLQWHPLYAINECHQQARRDRTIALTTWWMDWWLPASGKEKKKKPTAHFYFLTFWTLTCTTAARRGGRESLPALPPPSFTWTLSHCSYHPKQHIFHLRAVLIVPNTHTHKNSWHRLLDTKHSLLAYLQAYHTCVNNIKHYWGWCPNTYRLESTGLFYS